MFFTFSIAVSALHGRFFKDTHFIGHLEWKANDSFKIPIVQALHNPTFF